jgi:hypothetical protein
VALPQALPPSGSKPAEAAPSSCAVLQCAVLCCAVLLYEVVCCPAVSCTVRMVKVSDVYVGTALADLGCFAKRVQMMRPTDGHTVLVLRPSAHALLWLRL